MSPHAEHRRHHAINTYLADDNIAESCQQLTCAKSGRYTWRDRYDAHNPAWVQERATRPKNHPTQTPAHVVQAVLSLSVMCGATAMMEALIQQRVEPLPSRRTLYRLIDRYHKEATAHGACSSSL